MDAGNGSNSSVNKAEISQVAFPLDVPNHLRDQMHNILFNMSLAHEIALDHNFSFCAQQYPVNSLIQAVTDGIHTAYWDILQDQLSQTPPVLDRALLLLKDIRESLFDVLLPQQTKLKKEIADFLDLDLIKQQAEHDAFDFKEYARYVISLMAKICAPVRDEEIKALSQIQDLIPALRGIIETLNNMKLDMVNFKLNSVKPDVVANSVVYEREKFAEFLNLKGGGMPVTKMWLSAHKNSNGSTDILPALHRAFLDLLVWDAGKPYPETLVMDHQRFLKMQEEYYRLIILTTLLLVTLSCLGAELNSNLQFKLQIKKNFGLLIDGVKNDENLAQILPNIIEQAFQDANSKLAEMGLGPLNEVTMHMVRSQILQVTDGFHSVRMLVKRRVGDFLCYTLTTQPGEFAIPSALLLLKEELTLFAQIYQHVVSHNIKVFHTYYTDLLKEDS